MKMTRFALAAVTGITVLFAANVARAFSIKTVTVLPASQVSSTDEIEVVVQIVTPGQPPFLWGPTRVSTQGNEFHIDIFPASGGLAAIDLLWETVTLGTLPVGAYSYEVVIHPEDTVNWGTRTNRGVFSVVGGSPPPLLTLEEPRDGQQFDPGSPIPLRALLANAPGGPWGVQFFSGNQRIAESVPGQTVWWGEAWGGTHVLTARATNAQGTVLISTPKTVQVGPGAMLPVVSIDATPWRTGEPCPVCFVAPALLNIHRTEPTDTPLTVALAIDGTATPGLDYQALPETVEIPAGQRSVQLRLLPLDDPLVEGPEIVRVHVVRLPPYFVAPLADTVLVVIHDDEPGAPQARLDIVTPAEGAHLTFPSMVELSALAVNELNEVYGPVEFYADGQLVSRSTVTASTRPAIPGLPSVHTGSWNYPSVGPHVVTARTQLSFGLWVTSPPVNVTVDEPVLPIVRLETFPPADAQAREFCPPNLECAYPSFVVRRTGPTTSDLGVYLSYSGTATPGADYPPLPQSVVIPAGSDFASLTLVPTDDSLAEGPETVVASFTAIPGHFYIQDPNHFSATITILDNEVPPPTVVGIIAEDARATELPPWVDAVDPARFRISRSGDLSGDLLVFFSVLGSASRGLDYQDFTSPIRIPAGSDSAALDVIPIYDQLKEGTETVQVRLEPSPVVGPLPTYEIDPQHASAVATIFDLVVDGNQPPAVAISRPAAGAQFPPNTAIEIVADTRDPDGYVRTVEFFADGGKIGERSIEFIRPPEPGTTQTFSFLWREPAPGSHVLTARAIDDAGGAATSPGVAIQVALDVLPIVTVSATDCFAVEPSANSALNTAVFRLTRYGPTSAALAVSYSMRGTAENGVDYETLPGSAVIPEGSSSVSVIVRPLADNAVEGIETVILRLEDQPQYRLSFRRRAVALLLDSQPTIGTTGARWTRLPEGLFHVCFGAPTGGDFRVEASPDLRNWDTVFAGTAVDGTVQFVEEGLESIAPRFYRLAPEP